MSVQPVTTRETISTSPAHAPAAQPARKRHETQTVGERIAALQLAKSSSQRRQPRVSAPPLLSSDSTASSPARLSSQASVADKIARFQADAQPVPLLPRAPFGTPVPPAQPAGQQRRFHYEVLPQGTGAWGETIRPQHTGISLSSGAGLLRPQRTGLSVRTLPAGGMDTAGSLPVSPLGSGSPGWPGSWKEARDGETASFPSARGGGTDAFAELETDPTSEYFGIQRAVARHRAHTLGRDEDQEQSQSQNLKANSDTCSSQAQDQVLDADHGQDQSSIFPRYTDDPGPTHLTDTSVPNTLANLGTQGSISLDSDPTDISSRSSISVGRTSGSAGARLSANGEDDASETLHSALDAFPISFPTHERGSTRGADGNGSIAAPRLIRGGSTDTIEGGGDSYLMSSMLQTLHTPPPTVSVSPPAANDGPHYAFTPQLAPTTGQASPRPPSPPSSTALLGLSVDANSLASTYTTRSSLSPAPGPNHDRDARSLRTAPPEPIVSPAVSSVPAPVLTSEPIPSASRAFPARSKKKSSPLRPPSRIVSLAELDASDDEDEEPGWASILSTRSETR